MSKFIKNGSEINIVELSDNEVIALLKINIQCKLEFGETGKSIMLGDRLENSGINYISVSIDEGKTYEIIDYTKLLEMITTNYQDGILHVSVLKNDFQAKEPLLLMLGTIKEEIVHSCILIDYDLKNHIYSIINKSENGLSNKLYFFEDNNSILAFGKDGPSIIYGKINSIEDLICD